ncbi:YaeF family permuted papain-like enzyme [Rahnella ecdela]|uniref:YaeF family permuted papain-like enzyme n=1 Tax=Rahnella ecdela TaxID=2816250 RepID=A0ABS6LCI6_9GAMM|nr:YaeF family permuted papain-like enzyme [Rahnella ecdela]MBU9844468.1 YaeF family permuted papain-like enzyme [Rahnella ecdela]
MIYSSRTLFLSSVVFLSGCSSQTNITQQAELQPSVSKTTLHMQRISTLEDKDAVTINAGQLQPGDILLSSSTGVTSLGIRLFSMTGVSHASVYLGNGEVAEAVGDGVQIISLETALTHSNSMVSLRKQKLTDLQAAKLRIFSQNNQGRKYNYKGIIIIAPYTLTRRVCDLPLFFGKGRSTCIDTLATVQIGSTPETQKTFFCSQFVIEAFNFAGSPITASDALWISPADLLHMREGDVSSFVPVQPLHYVGHLKKWNLYDAVFG